MRIILPGQPIPKKMLHRFGSNFTVGSRHCTKGIKPDLVYDEADQTRLGRGGSVSLLLALDNPDCKGMHNLGMAKGKECWTSSEGQPLLNDGLILKHDGMFAGTSSYLHYTVSLLQAMATAQGLEALQKLLGDRCVSSLSLPGANSEPCFTTSIHVLDSGKHDVNNKVRIFQWYCRACVLVC